MSTFWDGNGAGVKNDKCEVQAVLLHFDFVAKFTVQNLNKDFTNTGRGEGHHFVKVFFHKIPFSFKRWLP